MGCPICNKNKKQAKIATVNQRRNPPYQNDGYDNNKPMFHSFTEAIQSQKNVFKWFKDGISGIVKCITNDKTIWTDEEIQKNRDICSGCEYATNKINGRITGRSQCMAPDPETGEKCGCILVCKTQVDNCPIGKFTKLTKEGV